MSLLRLLSAGKSLVGLQDSTARYRMGHPRAMPKFGSGKNPFQKASNPQPDSSAVSAAAPVAPPAPDACASSAEASEPKAQTQVASEVCQTPSAEAIQTIKQKPATTKPAKRSGSFFGTLLSPFRFLKRVRWSRKPKAPTRPPLRSPIQAELSLDCVKVIRNDLSDADLEVVSARVPRPVAVEKAETRIKRQETVKNGERGETDANRPREQLAEAGKT